MIELFSPFSMGDMSVVILLEELQIDYTIYPIYVERSDRRYPGFPRLVPGRRALTIIDHEPDGGGAPVSVSECGAILVYLARKHAKFYPQEPFNRYHVAQWLAWQSTHQWFEPGGQARYRTDAAGERDEDLCYSIHRFDSDPRPFCGVLNLGLFGQDYLVADEYTIADIVSYPWASRWKSRATDMGEFRDVERWVSRIDNRPAVEKARALGFDFSVALSGTAVKEAA